METASSCQRRLFALSPCLCQNHLYGGHLKSPLGAGPFCVDVEEGLERKSQTLWYVVLFLPLPRNLEAL